MGVLKMFASKARKRVEERGHGGDMRRQRGRVDGIGVECRQAARQPACSTAPTSRQISKPCRSPSSLSSAARAAATVELAGVDHE